MRKDARRVAFKVIFASVFTGELSESLKSALCKNEKLDDDDMEYIDRVLSLVEKHKSEFSVMIDERSASFPEARLFPADKSVLYLALAEIMYMDDIPARVSASEAADIAGEYSTEKSASFVGGLLAEFIGESDYV